MTIGGMKAVLMMSNSLLWLIAGKIPQQRTVIGTGNSRGKIKKRLGGFG